MNQTTIKHNKPARALSVILMALPLALTAILGLYDYIIPDRVSYFSGEDLPVYLFAGAILALTLYSSRSLFGAIIAHFLYNLFGLFGQPYMSALYNLTGSRSFFLFLVATVFFISGTVFCSSASALYKKYLYRGYSASYRRPVLTEPSEIRRSYLDVIRAPSAIACLAVYIIALIISWL